MAISFAESRLAPLAETDPAWKPFGLFARLPPAMEMLEEEFTEDASPRFGGRLWRSHSWSGYAAHRVARDCRVDGKVPELPEIQLSEREKVVEVPQVQQVEVNSDAIPKKRAQYGDDGESPSSTRGTPSPKTASWASWASECEEDGEYELAQFDSPHKPESSSGASTPGFFMDTPVSSDAIPKKCAQYSGDGEFRYHTRWPSWASECEEDHEPELAQLDSPKEPESSRRGSVAGFFMDTPAGGAAAPPTAEVTSARAEAAAPPAPPKEAPQLVTTLMVQNLKRSLTRQDFMLILDEEGFAGKYDFVHLPKSFGTPRNHGFAFVNFMKLEDVEEFARCVARIKGGKMRAVPAEVQGLSANAWKAGSRKVCRVRDRASRPLVISGHGQDAVWHT